MENIFKNNHHFFIIVPSRFYQCAIDQSFDLSSNENVPCIFLLLTGKSENIYNCLFNEISFILQIKRKSRIIAVDFELGLFASIKKIFIQSRIIGCFFILYNQCIKND